MTCCGSQEDIETIPGSLSGSEPEFEFSITSISNEEKESKPFVDCSLSQEKDPQSERDCSLSKEKVPQFESMDVYQEVEIHSEMALWLSRIAWSMLISGGRKASSTIQEDKLKFLHNHHGILSTVMLQNINPTVLSIS
ncbi:hypothetical protein AMTRI_Chr09g18080 [Amborella trichopoda]